MPQLQPFWDPRYNVDDPGPYIGNTYATNVWDRATVFGVDVPGVVSVAVTRSRYLWTIQAPGVAPQPIKAGWEPLRFTMIVKLWTPRQWAAMQPIMWRLQPVNQRADTVVIAGQTFGTPKPNTTDSSFDVYHPKLAVWSVGSAICERMGDLAGEQVKTLTIQFLEYRRGTSKVAKVPAPIAVVPAYDASQPQQQVSAANGTVTTMTPTQGPQVAPSSSPSLVPVP